MSSSFRFASLLLSLALMACCDGPSPGDAGPEDAGRDGGIDGGRDAGADAGRDAGEPLDGGPTDPGWIRLTQVPDPIACQIDVARYPDRVRPRPRFVACGDGCRQLVVDWEPNDRGARLFAGNSYHDGTHAYFVYGRPYEPGPGERGSYVLVARDDGQHLLAFRLVWDTGCSMASIGMTDRTFATAVTISDGTLRQSHPIRARFDEPIEQWATPAEPRPTINDHVVHTSTADTTSVYVGGVSGRAHRFDAAGAIDELGIGRNLTGGGVVGETVVVATEAASGWRVGVVLPGETDIRDLFIPADGSAWAPDTDGVDLLWEQTYPAASGSFERVELWTSPYATEPAGVAPRLLAEHPTPTPSSHGVGFGRAWAFQILGPDRYGIAIYTLDGSERRVWELPPERGFFSQPVVGPDEIGFFVDYADGPRGSETLRFYRYEALPIVPLPTGP